MILNLFDKAYEVAENTSVGDLLKAQNQNRFVVPRKTVEDEFHQAGFAILGHLDFLPGYAMWRTYVLRKEA